MNTEIIEVSDKTAVAPLFEGMSDTMIYTCLEGHMGTAYVIREKEISSAQLIIGDFCFFAGTPERALAAHCPADWLVMVPPDDRWESLIGDVWCSRAIKKKRYAIKKEADIFDTAKLTSYTAALPEGFKLKKIDAELYNKVMSENWSRDFCSNFNCCEDFLHRGVGYVVVKEGVPVSGASSFSIYSRGIEIEVDTRPDMRRRGLASAASAALILDCISKGLYPSWDAQNPISVVLSEKLGYHFDHEYSVYEVTSK